MRLVVDASLSVNWLAPEKDSDSARESATGSLDTAALYNTPLAQTGD